MNINIADVWEFVSTYYPKYDHCDTIAYADDLSKIMNDDELGDGSDAEELWQQTCDKYNGDMIQAKAEIANEYNAVHREIYEKAIQGYLDSLKPQQEPVTILVAWGSEKESRYSTIDAIPESEIVRKTFATQAEATAYMQGVEDMDGWQDYAVVQEDELLYPFTGMRGYFNPATGLTYQMDKQHGEDVADIHNEPIHLDYIETSDWWLSLSDEDWKLICQYHPPLSNYTKNNMCDMYEDGFDIEIKNIVSRQEPIPENCMVYITGTCRSTPYQNKPHFIENVVNQPDCILYVPYA